MFSGQSQTTQTIVWTGNIPNIHKFGIAKIERGDYMHLNHSATTPALMHTLSIAPAHSLVITICIEAHTSDDYKNCPKHLLTCVIVDVAQCDVVTISILFILFINYVYTLSACLITACLLVSVHLYVCLFDFLPAATWMARISLFIENYSFVTWISIFSPKWIHLRIWIQTDIGFITYACKYIIVSWRV